MSAVTDQTRHVPWATRLLLAVRAGGRCEFRGCNKTLFEHHVTLADGNFGEYAHIVAFSKRGPRGNDPARPEDPHDIDNLLLLCRLCRERHKRHYADCRFMPRGLAESALGWAEHAHDAA